jgi:hypothetical protein
MTWEAESKDIRTDAGIKYMDCVYLMYSCFGRECHYFSNLGRLLGQGPRQSAMYNIYIRLS